MSQYVREYLEVNRARGNGRGLTVGTFLAYTLRGRARNYAGRYAAALNNSLRRVGAVQGKSVRGYVAWYPAE